MSISLDIHASNVSPPENIDEKRATAKERRHKLRRAAGHIMRRAGHKIKVVSSGKTETHIKQYERVCYCGQNVVGSTGTIHSSEGNSHFGGV